MNWVLIGVCYLIIFLISCVVLFLQYMWHRRAKKAQASSRRDVQLEDQLMDPYDE